MSFGPLPTASQDRPQGLGYGARVGDLWLRLAVSRNTPLRTYTQDSLAGREADQSNSYENVLDIGYDYARSDFSGGEGLAWFPQPLAIERAERDVTRFFDSYNIDIERARSGELDALKLSPTTEEWWDSAGAASTVRHIVYSNTHLYVAAATTINRFDSWDDTTPDSSTDFTPQIVTSIAVDPADNGILVLDNGAVYKKDAGSATWDVLTNTATALDDAYRVWITKSRVIFAKAPSTGIYNLGELTWDAALATTFTSFDTFKADVYSVIDADIAILAVTGDGKIRSYVPQADAAGDVPLLTLRGISDVPGTEIPYAIGHNLGRVLVLTAVRSASDDATTHDIRAYSGVVLDERFDFIVGQLQLVREWFDAKEACYERATNLQPSCIVSDRDSFSWLIREGIADTDEANIWRQDLVTQGLSRHLNDPIPITDLEGLGLGYWKGRLVWSWLTDATVRRVADTYQPLGWLITPNINFGLNTKINWVSTVLHAANLDSSGIPQVELWISTDPAAINDWQHSSWKLIDRLSSEAGNSEENPLLEIAGLSAALQLRVFPYSNGAGTPEVTRFSIRGLPAHRDFIVELPVSVSDYVEVPGRRSQRIPHYGDEIHTQLLSMVGKHYELQIVQPPVSIRGIVGDILEPVEYISDRGSVGKVLTMQFRGTLVPGGQAGQVTGNETMGLGLMGVAIMGVGQSGVT